MNLANRISLLRILLVPLLVVVLMLPPATPWQPWLSLGFFIVLALSDYLDGWVARTFKQESDLGRFLDPLADKILIITLLCYFQSQGQIAFYWVALIIFRELSVSGLRASAALRQIVIQADQLGKWKTVSQMLAVGLMIIQFPFTEPFIYLMVALTVISGINYFWQNRKVF